MERYDVVVVGGGILGLATAWTLLRDRSASRLLLVEKEPRLAAHQTGRNSGVIHSGVYYPPDSLKARMVAASRRPLLDLCAAHGIPLEVTGKVVVATDEQELARLNVLEQRGRANGLRVRRLEAAALHELEPHAAGLTALHVPEAGVTDYAAVARALADEVVAAGGVVSVGCLVTRLDERSDEIVVETTAGSFGARLAVVCAGLHADELADPGRAGREIRIVPFRGDYFALAPSAAPLVRSLIYPVPDPRFPFLGVHLTRGVDGGVHAGPNAVPALAREGYRWRDIDATAMRDLLTFPGTRRLARRYWRTGLAEVRRSLSARAFTRAVQRLVPAIPDDALVRSPPGVRAQALRRDGVLVDDFEFRETRRTIHVVNAPSPAATAAFAIAAHIADVLGRHTD